MLDTMKNKDHRRGRGGRAFRRRPRQGHRRPGAGPAIRSTTCPACPASASRTAAQLIGEYGDLETLLARAGEIKQNEAARSRWIEIRRPGAPVEASWSPSTTDVPLERTARRRSACRERDGRAETHRLPARRIEFTSLTRRVAAATRHRHRRRHGGRQVAVRGWPPGGVDESAAGEECARPLTCCRPRRLDGRTASGQPAHLAAARTSMAARKAKFDRSDLRHLVVHGNRGARRLDRRSRTSTGYVAFDTAATIARSRCRPHLVGVGAGDRPRQGGLLRAAGRTVNGAD